MDRRSRYRYVSRRQVLQGSAGVGLAALLAACGSNDADVFASEPADPSVSEPTSTSTTGTSTTAGDSSTSAPTTSSVTSSALAIDFTYTFGDGGKRLNPYIAVWIEDADGNLARTVALWFEQSQKGSRWLPDLKRWFVVDEADFGPDAIETVSTATRQPGSFTVAWDGLDDDGNPTSGPVFVCIESARERGPYSLIRESYDFSSTGATALEADGELSNASVTRV